MSTPNPVPAPAAPSFVSKAVAFVKAHWQLVAAFAAGVIVRSVL